MALTQFHEVYGRFPVQGGSDLPILAESTLLLPLLSEDHTTNPRKIRFAEFPAAKEGIPGLAGTPLELVDSWNRPYYVILDSDKDGKVANPESGANSASTISVDAVHPLHLRVAIYSSGPDRDAKTWKDNIVSWR